MNNMTATEAGRNFSAAIKKTESEGLIGIEKNGKLGYVLMTKERFDGMKSNVYFGKRGKELIKVAMGSERVEISQLCRYEGAEDMAVMRRVNLPSKGVELKVSDGKFEVFADFENLREKNPGASISSEFNDLIMMEDEYSEYYEEMPEAWKVLCEAKNLAEEFAGLDEKSIYDGEITLMVPGAKGKFNQLAPFTEA